MSQQNIAIYLDSLDIFSRFVLFLIVDVMIKRFIKGVLILEVAAVIGAYRVWHDMNTDEGW